MIRIFLSSKVNPIFENLEIDDFSLGDLREYLKVELESQKLLGKRLFKVIMNEEGFESNFDKDAFDACIEAVEESDVIVILYNGDAGWAPDKDKAANGICHEEYLIAVNEHPSMTFGVNLSKYFQKIVYNKDQITRNNKFDSDIASLYRFKEYSIADTVDELKKYILKLVVGYISKSFDLAFNAKKQLDANNIVFGKTLEWHKLTYPQRVEQIKALSTASYSDIFPNTICLFHAIPDNLSISDARNSLGRPFLYEDQEILGTKLTKGVIHFVTTYGNATETQVKNLIGFPDITLIKTSFGFYLWEQTTQIQYIVISKCINPSVINTRKQQVVNWLKASKEKRNINIRSNERFKILKVINSAKAKTK